MDPISQQLMTGAAGAGGDKIYVEDVFSTWLYTGNGSTQTITNGIDLAGEGGMVWFKGRSVAENHRIIDTVRGSDKGLRPNSINPEGTNSLALTSFNSDGFSIGSNAETNYFNATIASWTFRKAPKFFDVVTYTGNGTNRTIAHNLGSVPGCIIVKRTDSSENWVVYHRSLPSPEQSFILLNSTAAVDSTTFNRWGTPGNVSITSTHFSVGTADSTNASGATYVAYLFAHDAGGFGDSGNESVVSCGSFTTNGSGVGSFVDLGWEPQWVLVKSTNTNQDWWLFDTMRGIPTGGIDALLSANTSAAENVEFNYLDVSATGFQLVQYGSVSSNYIYIAIRRGPMKMPTSGTEVYITATQGSAGDGLAPGYRSTFPVDFAFWTVTNSAGSNRRVMSRMQGFYGMYSDLTNAEASFSSAYKWDYQNGFWDNTGTGTTNRAWMFRRAPGFFDVVAYTGTGSTQTISHNLGVAPELMIIKSRSAVVNWIVYSSDTWGNYSNFDLLKLNTNNGAGTNNVLLNYTQPTDSVISIGSSFNETNGSGATYIAYLFATCPGVSKVGSYTGTGTTLSIDCGFTSGARFVLIKRTDSTGDWYVWDTARGIVSGNDPYILLNSTTAEVTSTDYIDPLSSGFQISSTAPAAINASGGSYIYLSVA